MYLLKGDQVSPRGRTWGVSFLRRMTDKNLAPERLIAFDRKSDGSWTASIDTPDGPLIGLGATIAAARLALDKLLKLREP